ncbi:hypothetical protein [Streptomyces sp. NBC_01443]|uniref:hypothetical protein n=1 Tax=Streptomyces sp. NBC_01443 TaxID=2903868 RepID=UPI002254947D|nr:hypothetical protein [Streptomyces sp. NBC_01443]MCX4627720.1 hypothetical protein [Streptomyces sp. NBC_01443]
MEKVSNEMPDQPSRFMRARFSLERFAPVAWLAFPSEFHSSHTRRQLSYFGWRFSEPHDELDEMFTMLAHDAPQNIEWTFTRVKNSMIAPKRLTIESGPDGRNFLEARTAITSDQDFCLAAAEDMELILQALAGAAGT